MTCPSCTTALQVELSAGITRVKCSACEHVFKNAVGAAKRHVDATQQQRPRPPALRRLLLAPRNRLQLGLVFDKERARRAVGVASRRRCRRRRRPQQHLVELNWQRARPDAATSPLPARPPDPPAKGSRSGHSTVMPPGNAREAGCRLGYAMGYARPRDACMYACPCECGTIGPAGWYALGVCEKGRGFSAVRKVFVTLRTRLPVPVVGYGTRYSHAAPQVRGKFCWIPPVSHYIYKLATPP